MAFLGTRQSKLTALEKRDASMMTITDVSNAIKQRIKGSKEMEDAGWKEMDFVRLGEKKGLREKTARKILAERKKSMLQ